MDHKVLQLGVAKFSCMSRWEWLFVMLRRGGGGPEVNVTMTLRNPKAVWMRPLNEHLGMYNHDQALVNYIG